MRASIQRVYTPRNIVLTNKEIRIEIDATKQRVYECIDAYAKVPSFVNKEKLSNAKKYLAYLRDMLRVGFKRVNVYKRNIIGVK